MAFSLYSSIVLIFAILPILCAHNVTSDSNRRPGAFEFLNHLKGCHKGETIQGVHNLKQYLQKFGYLNNDQSNNSHVDDNEFDDFLESGVKEYQKNYHLNATGTLDSKTLETMMMPRCGFPDIFNGTTRMGSREKKDGHIHTVSHYSFFPGTPRWSHLTYAFDSTAQRDTLASSFIRAFTSWATVSIFTFEEITDYNASDIVIGFHTGDHGDGYPFDGPGGTIAHAFAPPDGRFHFDGDEKFSSLLVNGTFDIETIALHEIGHLLGLDHSSIEGAIMFPTIPHGVRKGLHEDDIQGIKALYSR